jgi:hypothetical protein
VAQVLRSARLADGLALEHSELSFIAKRDSPPLESAAAQGGIGPKKAAQPLTWSMVSHSGHRLGDASSSNNSRKR